MSTSIDSATAHVFRTLSALRGKRIFHPDGVGFSALLKPHAPIRIGASLLDDQTPRRAIVRLSRSIGLPEPLPDALGLSIRVPDAYGAGLHQDFLLVTSSTLPLGRHLLLPAPGFLAQSYSSLLPYRVAGKLVVVGALPRGGDNGPSLADLHRAAVSITFELALAPPWGSWTEVATLQIGERLPDDEVEELRFDPSNTGGAIELAGLLNRLRRPAYRGSQEGRSEGRAARPMQPRPAQRARRRAPARTVRGSSQPPSAPRR